MTHISVCKLVVIGSDNGLSSGRRHANIWTNAGILLIGPLGTHFSEIFIEIHTFSFKKFAFEKVVVYGTGTFRDLWNWSIVYYSPVRRHTRCSRRLPGVLGRKRHSAVTLATTSRTYRQVNPALVSPRWTTLSGMCFLSWLEIYIRCLLLIRLQFLR